MSELTQEEILSELRAYKETSDDDNIRFKEIIKQKLLNNQKIIHVIHNTNLNEDEPDAYFGINIKPFILLPEVQDEPMNYICFKTEFEASSRENEIKKYERVTFLILCDGKTLIDDETGIARHDLLGSIIREEFNYSNCFGSQAVLIADKESTTDSNYATRTLTFSIVTTKNILKTENGITSIINKEVRR